MKIIKFITLPQDSLLNTLNNNSVIFSLNKIP